MTPGSLYFAEGAIMLRQDVRKSNSVNRIGNGSYGGLGGGELLGASSLDAPELGNCSSSSSSKRSSNLMFALDGPCATTFEPLRLSSSAP